MVWLSTGHTGSGRLQTTDCYVAELPAKRFHRVEEVPAVRCYAVVEAPDGAILVGSGGRGFPAWRGAAGGRSRPRRELRHGEVLAVAALRPNEFWVGYWYSGSVTRVRVEGERLSMTHFGSELGFGGR